MVLTDIERLKIAKSPTISKHGVEWYLEVGYDSTSDYVSVYLHVNYSTKSQSR